MYKIILQNKKSIPPFNEPARDLRITNKPLWLVQRDILAPYTEREMELPTGAPMPDVKGPCLVYRDNLFFDGDFITYFLDEAKKMARAVQAAFSLEDGAFREHCLPLSTSYTQSGDLYLVDLWYYPDGITDEAEPLVVNMAATEIGYYNVPTYMAQDRGELVYQVPLRSLIAIDSWVHVFIADSVFHLFGRAARFENRLNVDPLFKLQVLALALWEGKQVLECSGVVQIGRNCTIDPTATIHGPAAIGDNVTINAGVVIENCTIGNNVNISQDCQLMLSVIGDGTFLPFRAALFMTTIMDNSMVAQNTCLQMSVVGRNAFVGAGNTFTDFNLLSDVVKARDGSDQLSPSNRPVLGSCVGHNCRIGSGMIFYPARMIESDVVLLATQERRIIDRDVPYEESDHHRLRAAHLHRRLYPRPGEQVSHEW
jgi:UDP-N-acetylglucosamine diphosphorylase / glucose-1-phosphate thymidylyltransferase / UDP-N-acetylgalactosamine diphosphorylase / glucosamine-1-phosphate N-acetyltransferase / galactosamine-1-phosphate N-acetyltransferase